MKTGKNKPVADSPWRARQLPRLFCLPVSADGWLDRSRCFSLCVLPHRQFAMDAASREKGAIPPCNEKELTTAGTTKCLKTDSGKDEPSHKQDAENAINPGHDVMWSDTRQQPHKSPDSEDARGEYEQELVAPSSVIVPSAAHVLRSNDKAQLPLSDDQALG